MLILEDMRTSLGTFDLTADISIPAGARVAIVGPSGAGKSTLLNTIAGFETPVQGDIIWDGAKITHLDPGARPMSVVFQDNNLFPHMSVFQNTALGVRPNMRLSADEKTKVLDAIERVGLAGFEDRKPAALSGGQQSRVALARVLVRDKPIMLLDEPFSALGPALRVEMLDLVKDLTDSTGATLLMVTHDPQDALRIADQTVLVADGQAHAPQVTADLMKNPPPALRDYLGRPD